MIWGLIFIYGYGIQGGVCFDFNIPSPLTSQEGVLQSLVHGDPRSGVEAQEPHQKVDALNWRAPKS